MLRPNSHIMDDDSLTKDMLLSHLHDERVARIAAEKSFAEVSEKLIQLEQKIDWFNRQMFGR